MLTAAQRNDLHYWIQNKYGIALGASASSVQPEDIPDAAGVWIADDIAQANGSPVAAWTDRVQSVDFTQATGAKQPLYATAGLINAQPAIDLDGINDQMATPTAISHRDEGHIFAVIRFRSASGGNAESIFRSAGSNGPLFFSRLNLSADNIMVQENATADNSWYYSTSDALDANTDYLVELNSNGSLWEIRVNGVVMTLGVVHPPNAGLWFSGLGSGLTHDIGHDTIYTNCQIAALIVICRDDFSRPFEYRYRWTQIGPMLNDPAAPNLLDERDNELEDYFGDFQYPARWPDLIAGVLAGDPRAIAELDERDVALEDRIGDFQYSYRWPDLAPGLRAGDPMVWAALEMRDIDLEDHLSA